MSKLRSQASRVTLLSVACFAGAAHAAGPVAPLVIDTASGPHRFAVEWMMTEAERERGLMDRKTMARDHGMLFDFRPDAVPVVFWMKDTYLPLDMIFIGPDGHVVNIAHDARPMDTTMIPSNAPTLGVLEVDAGVANAIGVKVGDKVEHAMFGDPPAGQP